MAVAVAAAPTCVAVFEDWPGLATSGKVLQLLFASAINRSLLHTVFFQHIFPRLFFSLPFIDFFIFYWVYVMCGHVL